MTDTNKILMKELHEQAEKYRKDGNETEADRLDLFLAEQEHEIDISVKLAKMEADMAVLKKDVADKTGEIDTIKEENVALSEKLKTIEGEKVELEKKLSDAEKKVKEPEKKVTPAPKPTAPAPTVKNTEGEIPTNLSQESKEWDIEKMRELGITYH